MTPMLRPQSPARPLALATALAMAPGLAGFLATANPAGANPPPAPSGAPTTELRRQTVAPLPGGLDRVPMINDNNPELIKGPGILFSSFAGMGRGVPSAHLDQPLAGRFDLFSHHVYAGTPESLDSTLWLAVLAAPRGERPVRLTLLEGSTALSQSLDSSQPSAPFLPLPALLPQGATAVFSGPGSRVATELLRHERAPLLPQGWSLPPGNPTPLVVLPLPVRGLDPLLNGRNLQMRLRSDGPVDVATLAAFGPVDRPPDAAVWSRLLEGPLSPKEHSPSPRGSTGRLIYSRVSGIQAGSRWRGRITDPGSDSLSVRRAPISWPISSLERGRLGTEQVQTAELTVFYPGTAWAAHGNYGVEYDLSLPLSNDTAEPVRLELALDSPIKVDRPEGGLRFRTPPSRAVMFRGTIQVAGLDGSTDKPSGLRGFHLVLRAGERGRPLGTVSLAPGEQRRLRVRLIYPADATPPQVLSLLPAARTSPSVQPVRRGS